MIDAEIASEASAPPWPASQTDTLADIALMLFNKINILL